MGKDGQVEFEIDFPADGPADLVMQIAGVPTAAAFDELNTRLVSDPRFRAGLTILVDVEWLDSADLTDEEVEVLSAPIAVRDWDYLPKAVAIVAPDERTYATMRKYRAHLGGSKSNRQVFTTRQEALAWLEQQGS
ncbi:MAG: hypothetical protein QOK22_1337 [Gaiellaceae bacterium]|nr:hypothetical protein [Gaiellaceae bacterium]